MDKQSSVNLKVIGRNSMLVHEKQSRGQQYGHDVHLLYHKPFVEDDGMGDRVVCFVRIRFFLGSCGVWSRTNTTMFAIHSL